jgi:hypothetical protein
MGAEGTELVGAIRDCLIIPMLFREWSFNAQRLSKVTCRDLALMFMFMN